MDVIVTVSYSEVHGPPEVLKAFEQEATRGRRDRAFQPVQIVPQRQNIPLKP